MATFIPYFSPQNSQHIALQAENITPISYSALRYLLQDASQQLTTLGITQDCRVALLLPQGILNALACLTVMSNCVAVPLNPAATPEDWQAVLLDCSVSVVITVPEIAGSLQPIVSYCDVTVCLVALESSTAEMPHLVFSSERLSNHTPIELIPGLSLILQTSGSSGQPKYVPLTIDNLLTSAQNIIDSLALSTQDCVLNALPFFHIGAILDTLLVPLLSGGTVVVANAMNAATISRLLDQYPVTWYQAVPTMLADLLSSASENLSGQLRFIRSVSAPLPITLKTQIESMFVTTVVEIYGMTEACGEITSNSINKNEQIIGSVGSVRHTQVCIFDESGMPLLVNQEGQIGIAGKNVIKNYLLNKQNSHIFINGTQWFLTGDNGYIDSDKHLFLTGRCKDIINRGGEKISPAQIDQIAMQCDGVKDAACFALPHPTLGEEVALCFVPQDMQSASIVTADIHEYLCTHLPSFKQPRKIFVASELPRTIGGKLQRFRLTEQYAMYKEEHTVSQSLPDDAVTLNICHLWGKILGIDQVQPDDDFFDLGGDSLKAVDFILSLEKQLGLAADSISVSLYDASTARAFASALHATGLVKSSDLVQSDLPDILKRRLRQHLSSWPGKAPFAGSLLRNVNVHSHIQQPILFWCVQSAHEGKAIVQALSNRQPLYLMRSLYKIVARDKRDNIGLARHYAAEIMALGIQECVVGGFCEGGKVAFLLAQELRTLGCKVKLLCLHDAFVPQYYDAPVALYWSKMTTTLLSVRTNPDIRARQFSHNIFSTPELGWHFYYHNLISCHNYISEHNDFYTTPLEVTKLCEDMLNDINSDSKNYQAIPLPFNYPKNEDELKRCLAIYHRRKINFSISHFWPSDCEQKTVSITLTNLSDNCWLPTEQSGIAIQACWRRYNYKHKYHINTFELSSPLPAGASLTFDLLLAREMPAKWRIYWLEIDLVMQGICWLSCHDRQFHRKLIFFAGT